jgi:hypothetical protein
LEFSPKPLSSGDQAEEIAQTFGGLYREVLNRTVTADNIRVRPVKSDRNWTEWQWLLSKLNDDGIPLPVSLNGGVGWLLAEHRVGVRRSSTDGLFWLTTLRYRYQWQAAEDDGTWLIRWTTDAMVGHLMFTCMVIQHLGRRATSTSSTSQRDAWRLRMSSVFS